MGLSMSTRRLRTMLSSHVLWYIIHATNPKAQNVRTMLYAKYARYAQHRYRTPRSFHVAAGTTTVGLVPSWTPFAAAPLGPVSALGRTLAKRGFTDARASASALVSTVSNQAGWGMTHSYSKDPPER